MIFKYGRMWEFPVRNKNFHKFLLLRFLSLFIDLLLLLIPQLFLFLFMPISIYILSIAVFAWGFAYMNLMLLVFEKSIGMIVTRTSVSHKTGFLVSKMQLSIRSIIFGVYSFPILGWSILTVSFLTSIIFKGITPNDYLSSTGIFSNKALKVFREFEENLQVQSI